MSLLVSHSPSAPTILGSPTALLARPPSSGAMLSGGGGLGPGSTGRLPRRGKGETAEAYVRALRERGVAAVDALAPAVREHVRLLPSR